MVFLVVVVVTVGVLESFATRAAESAALGTEVAVVVVVVVVLVVATAGVVVVVVVAAEVIMEPGGVWVAAAVAARPGEILVEVFAGSVLITAVIEKLVVVLGFQSVEAAVVAVAAGV